MPYILDGHPISLDRPFAHNGVQYPANWIRLATEGEKAAIGLTYEADPPAYDQRFYWGFDADGALIPKEHEQLVEHWVRQCKSTAGILLNPSDWYITRQAETGIAVPVEILDRRSEIRAFSNAKEEALVATTSTEELAAYVTSPDYNHWGPGPLPEPEPEPEVIEELSPAPVE